jgi:FKBP-type peptidyl-prolyl cis-trans isomerase
MLVLLPLLAGPSVAHAGQEPAPATPAGEAAELEDEREKSSYAVGMNLGGALRRQSPDLDVDLIVKGFADALAGNKTLLSPMELRAILTRLQAEARTRLAAQQTEKATKNKAASEAFLAENKAREGVVTLESGLQYRILKPGQGEKPTIADTVVCNYRGTLIDGTEFDSSYGRDRPATLALKRVIKGWAEALQLMPAGSRWEIVVPPSLAYGERGSGRNIGPNAALVFDVELVSIEPASAAAASPGSSRGDEAAPEVALAAAPAVLAGINVSFKVDPRIAKGLYMGDRWAPVPFSQIGETRQVTVEARAEGIDGSGKPVAIEPQWITADPELASVSPERGKAVRITALRPGESSLRVVSEGISRDLAVKAAYKGEVLQVQITPAP